MIRAMTRTVIVLFAFAAAGLWPLPVLAQNYIYEAAGAKTATLVIYSSADTERFDPLIRAFQKIYPGIAINYHLLDTVDIYARALREADAGASTADLLISSAMDLQIKIVNDGYAAAYSSSETRSLPRWARWRNEAFGFTFEPAVILYNRKLAPELGKIKTRFELANLIGREATRFRGKVITYDPERSGLGYLFGTQDVIQSEDFWYLARSMGDSKPQLSGSSGDMIRKVDAGEVLIAYNVLGSYALAEMRGRPDIGMIIPGDYCLAMQRIAIIAKAAKNPEAAGKFIDFLLSHEGQKVIAGAASLYSLHPDVQGRATISGLRKAAQGPVIPIRLGPGLLVYLDTLKREDFLRRWRNAMNRR